MVEVYLRERNCVCEVEKKKKSAIWRKCVRACAKSIEKDMREKKGKREEVCEDCLQKAQVLGPKRRERPCFYSPTSTMNNTTSRHL